MKKFKVFHQIDQATIDEMFTVYKPVFILSTGRSGSKFMNYVFEQLDETASYHEAFPTLQYFSNFAFQNQENLALLEAMFNAARFELILSAYNQNKVFIESNQCLVFFAPVINKLFGNARFIHLIRHPGDFIRSAIMKGWHFNDSIWESGRVRMNNDKEWCKLNHIEKLAWVWVTTNAYIKSFLKTLDSKRYLVTRLEDIVSNQESLANLLRFAGSLDEVLREKIKRLQSTKVNELHIHENEPSNMKKISYYPPYSQWRNEDKEKVRKIVGDLPSKFGYEI